MRLTELKLPKTNTIVIFALLLKNVTSLGMKNVTWDIQMTSKVVFGVLFALALLAGIMTILAAFLPNKPVNLLASWRFSVFLFGIAATMWIGAEASNGFRGNLLTFWLGYYYNRFFDEIWGFENKIKIFKDVQNSSGVVYYRYFNFINRHFIEILIIVITRLVAFGKDKRIKNMYTSIITWASVRIVVSDFWVLKTEVRIRRSNKNEKTDYNLKTFGNVIHWISAVILGLLVLENLIMMFYNVSDLLKKMDQSKDEKKNAYKDGEKENESAEEYAFQHNPRKKILFKLNFRNKEDRVKRRRVQNNHPNCLCQLQNSL